MRIKKGRKVSKSTAQKPSVAPKFKPGNKPYLEFEGQILNSNVKWDQVVQEIIAQGYTAQQIGLSTGLRKAAITKVLHQQYDELFFRAGAAILTIHCKLYPDLYTDA